MRRAHLDLDGPVHHADFGGEGPPLLLVHGLAGSLINWMAVGPELARLGRVRALDLVGFGRTPLAGRSAAVDANAELVVRFLEAMDEGPAVLVGNSMGGLVSLLVAARFPEHVRGLVLVNPAVPPLPLAGLAAGFALRFSLMATPWLGERLVRRRLLVTPPETYVEEMLAMVCHRPESVGEAIRAEHLALARERREMPWAAGAFISAARSVVPKLMPSAYTRLARQVRAPTLLMTGEYDRVVSAASVRRLAQARPDWELAVVHGVGHVPQLETPAEFVERVAGWLTRQALAA